MRRAASLLILAILLTTAGCGDDGSSGAEGGSGTPSGSVAAALSDAELQERWWNWALQDHSAPIEDRTGEFCALGQPDDVWFLAGTFGGRATRSCRVPADRPLAFPVVTITTTVADDCAAFLEDAKGSATLDGEPLEVEPIGATAVTLETDHGAGDYQSCGLWVRTDGLARGPHELEFSGSAGALRLGVAYSLTSR